MNFKEFNYDNIEDVKRESDQLNVGLKFADNFEVFKKKIEINGFLVPNSIAIHPMEGCDGKADGSPDELTLRRYHRFAKGGAGLLWFEAVAVVHEGRANPRQLWIHENNLSKFQEMFEQIKCDSQAEYGYDFTPLTIMQLTHSGRYSRPNGKLQPIIACHNPYLDAAQKIDGTYPVITDTELEMLEEKYEEAAVLAYKAGFHGVDVKSCHRYLNSELLSGFTRQGRYGETFEGRTRFLTNIVDRIQSRLGSKFIVTTRINIHDSIPYPYGWGTDKDDHTKYDLIEPIKLVDILYKKGVKLINLTMGNPYYNPHVNRPYDKGSYVPPEHPLEGVARLTNGIAQVQKAVPGIAVVGTGYSWLRQFSAHHAAANIENGNITFAGFGREAFAYPDFAKDILQNGGLAKEKCCIACGKCTDLMRAGGTPGCIIKDAKVYGALYKNIVK